MPSLVITVISSIDNIEKIKFDAVTAVENVLDENDIEEDDNTQVEWDVVEV